MDQTTAVILAAGHGRRMKSDLAKVLHLLGGKPLIVYPLRIVTQLKIPSVCVVVSKENAKAIQAALQGVNDGKITWVIQDPPLGTGHAVMCALESARVTGDDVMVLNGDMPFVRKETLKKLRSIHRGQKAHLSMVTSEINDQSSYGRVLRGASGAIKKIVEYRDASIEEQKIREVNLGIYLIRTSFLKAALKKIKRGNAQKEYYLTDLVEVAFEEKKVLASVQADPVEGLGINTPEELIRAHQYLDHEFLHPLD